MARELRIIRTLYWTLWFVVAPLCLALVLVWALTPPSGVDPSGVLGWVQSAVREQPVPVVIVAFTLFEMALWAARHELPFAHHALPPLRAGVPEALRGPFERARALIDEADGILATHQAAVVRELSAQERDQIKSDLDDLRVAIDKTPFDEDLFLDSLTPDPPPPVGVPEQLPRSAVVADAAALGPWREMDGDESVGAAVC